MLKTQGEDHGKMEAEIRVMRPQAKEHLGLPEDGGGQEGSYPTGFRGRTALPTLISDFLPPE